MAYADLEFYKTKYYGNVVPDEDFPRIAERASDFIDIITFDRLIDNFPTSERSQIKIKKAVCAVSDRLYYMELAEKQALSVAASSGPSGASEKTTGIITSMSSGSESISYVSPTEIANGAKAWNNIFDAVGNEKATNELLVHTATPYLTGIKTDRGVLLLYAGYGC